MKPQSQKLKNHIIFCLDASGSMSTLRSDVVKVFNAQIENLIKKSQEMEQETRDSPLPKNDGADSFQKRFQPQY